MKNKTHRMLAFCLVAIFSVASSSPSIEQIIDRLVVIYKSDVQDKVEKRALHDKLLSYNVVIVPVLDKHFASKDPIRRVVVLYALEDILKEGARDYILRGLNDSAGDVRIAAVFIASRYKSNENFDALVRLLNQDKDEHVRMLAMAAVGDYKNDEAYMHLNEKLKDKNPKIRKAANVMLQKLSE